MVYSSQLNYSDVSKRTGVQTTRGPARSSAYLLSRSEWTQINRSKLVWLSMIFPTAICWFILKPQKKLFKKLHNRSPNHQSPFSKYPWTQSGTIWPFQQRRPNQLTNQLGASSPTQKLSFSDAEPQHNRESFPKLGAPAWRGKFISAN